MDSLIALGTTASVAYGIYVIYQMLNNRMGNMTHYLYFESAGMILTLVSMGKFFESRAKGRTGEAISRLVALRPATAVLFQDGKEREIPLSQVSVGDILVVRPGQTVPVDGGDRKRQFFDRRINADG